MAPDGSRQAAPAGNFGSGTGLPGASVARTPATRPPARPEVLSLKSIDRALGFGDLASFIISGLVASRIMIGGAEGAATYAVVVLLAALVFSRMLHQGGVYRTSAHVVNLRLVRRLIPAILFTFVVITAVTFALRPGDDYSREWLLVWLLASGLAIFSYRLVLAALVQRAIRRGHLRRRVAIYGGEAQGVALIEHLQASQDEHYAVIGYYDERNRRVPDRIGRVERRGGLAELQADVEQGAIDDVIVALPLAAVDRMTEIMSRLSRYSVTVLFAPDLAMWRFFDRPFETVGGAPMLRALDSPITGWAGAAKFVEDKLLALVLVVLVSPLLLAAAVAIRLDSAGPVFFRQPRRGWNGGVFTIYKFRTMRIDLADYDGARQTTRDDPRITRVGRLLRRTSIDELPQLLNVLTGDMSLVGPRPHALGTRSEGKPFDEAVADYMRRYRVKPGITGWAQVNGWRGETDTNRKLLLRVRYDIEYIENWTFWFDLYIIAITPLSLIVRSHNAY